MGSSTGNRCWFNCKRGESIGGKLSIYAVRSIVTETYSDVLGELAYGRRLTLLIQIIMSNSDNTGFLRGRSLSLEPWDAKLCGRNSIPRAVQGICLRTVSSHGYRQEIWHHCGKLVGHLAGLALSYQARIHILHQSHHRHQYT